MSDRCSCRHRTFFKSVLDPSFSRRIPQMIAQKTDTNKLQRLDVRVASSARHHQAGATRTRLHTTRVKSMTLAHIACSGARIVIVCPIAADTPSPTRPGAPTHAHPNAAFLPARSNPHGRYSLPALTRDWRSGAQHMSKHHDEKKLESSHLTRAHIIIECPYYILILIIILTRWP